MSISEENDKLSQQLNPQEVGSLARSSPRTKGAAGNCWQDLFQTFEMMTSEEQLRTKQIRQNVFKRNVLQDWRGGDDVYVNCIASCREYTFSRTYADSEAKLWIHKYTETGLVLNVQVVCQHNVCGIEIQISLTAGDNTKCPGGHIQEAEIVTWTRVTIQRIRKSSSVQEQ